MCRAADTKGMERDRGSPRRPLPDTDEEDGEGTGTWAARTEPEAETGAVGGIGGGRGGGSCGGNGGGTVVVIRMPRRV